MKKLIFVNNNMNVGGVQKSLVNLLSEIKDDYDISLLLFSPTGEYMRDIPECVKIIPCTSLFRTLGISQEKSRSDFGLHFERSALALITRLFGRSTAMRLILLSQKVLVEHYDCAVSFLQNPGDRVFYGGCNEFVLEKIHAGKKIAFLHCDYENCGAATASGNAMYERFDKIAACSEGCRKAFLRVLPQCAEKCHVVPNCHNYSLMRKLAQEGPVVYDKNELHVVSVGRLAHEKAMDRGIRAVAYALAHGCRIKYHLIGDGAMRQQLETLAAELGITESVEFCGNSSNPYRYMKNADLLLISSLHEAAPLVVDEALCLGVPVLSTETTSSTDMIINRGLGWVCGNNQDAINAALLSVATDRDALKQCRSHIKSLECSNTQAVESFRNLLASDAAVIPD